MSNQNILQEPPVIKEVERHQARYRKLSKVTSSSTKAAAVMLGAALLALVIANTDAYFGFVEFCHSEVGFFFGSVEIKMSLSHVINDIGMAVFFLLIGLEIKYEVMVGELTNIRQALLPVIAALGGVLVPIGIYLIFNGGNPTTLHGWGVPMATDIAFALGVLSLLGKRIPHGLRVFLTTLAVADDIMAIAVIALFYGQTPDVFWLGAIVLVMTVLVLMNRGHVYALVPYLIGGVLLWYCVYMSGIHATIAGVLLAFTIPSGSRIHLKRFISWSSEKVQTAKALHKPDEAVMGQPDYIATVSGLSRVARQVVPPALRLEHRLGPWVYFTILPLFALTNAAVRVVGGSLGNMWQDPVLPGVFLGLLLGKPIGIVLFSFIATKLNVVTLPKNTRWVHMLGAGILGGIGFTMALFVANLAFDEPTMVATAKLAILAASALASSIGFVFLALQAQKQQASSL